ncbi:MAG: hypothetical protein L0L04_04315, partial [Staphylococcus equorum]|nr:hypothetical protein [Staphylococcus equorum]
MIDYETRNKFKKELPEKTNEELLSLIREFTKKSRELLTSLARYETSDAYTIIKQIVDNEYYRTTT